MELYGQEREFNMTLLGAKQSFRTASIMDYGLSRVMGEESHLEW